jgi:hypothetical protein
MRKTLTAARLARLLCDKHGAPRAMQLADARCKRYGYAYRHHGAEMEWAQRIETGVRFIWWQKVWLLCTQRVEG